MAAIHIIENDKEDNALKSLVISSEDIITFKTIYYKKNPEEKNVVVHYDVLEIGLSGDEPFSFGSNPTIYRIKNGKKIFINTTNIKEFEQAYLECLSDGFSNLKKDTKA